MNIKETLQYLTSYRDGLTEFIKTRLYNFIKDYSTPRPPIEEQCGYHGLEDMPVYLTHGQIDAILTEIVTCNLWIEYLHGWDKYYEGPVVPWDNREIITTVDQLIYKKGKENYWLDTYTKR